MQVPLQVTFRRMAHSDALAARVQQRADKLEQLYSRIVSCHVVVELAGHHHRDGDRFRVSLNVGLPGHELIASNGSSEDRGPEDARAAADGAFDEIERQLEDWVRRQRDHRHEGRSPA
jgi:ribosomal subunit interface protein